MAREALAIQYNPVHYYNILGNSCHLSHEDSFWVNKNLGILHKTLANLNLVPCAGVIRRQNDFLLTSKVSLVNKVNVINSRKFLIRNENIL